MPSHDHVDLAAQRHPIRRHGANEAPAAQTHHPLVQLQRNLGNATVARMLAQRAAPEDEMQMKRIDRAAEEDELQTKRIDRAAEEDELQTKRIDRAGEEDELQTKRLDRAAEEDELQTKREGGSAPEVGAAGGPISEGLSSRIESARGGGSTLDEGSRTQMESAFGHSFADVRVHEGSEAAELNRSVGAKAFTTGTDVFFGAGTSPSDTNLLAHELTHVVQQRGSSGGSGGPMTVGPAGDHHEQAADAAASAVASGGIARLEDASAPAAQRQIAREGAEDELAG